MLNLKGCDNVTGLNSEEEKFYIYAMKLFLNAGHVFASSPEFINHSSEQFVYFDNKFEVSFSKSQRLLLRGFNNISRLFTENECAFFSINLITNYQNRSQVANDIHMLIHPLIGTEGTICLFKWNEEVMFTFVGFGYRCILSDWYSMIDDYASLLEKLDIANLSIDRGKDYFLDMIYSLAREYFLKTKPNTYDIRPIDYKLHTDLRGLSKEEIEEYVKREINAPNREYGEDYVEYDNSMAVEKKAFGAEFDLMVLNADDIASKKITAKERDASYSKKTEVNKEKYDYGDIDPEILRDPILLAKWIEKKGI